MVHKLSFVSYQVNDYCRDVSTKKGGEDEAVVRERRGKGEGLVGTILVLAFFLIGLRHSSPRAYLHVVGMLRFMSLT